MHLASSLEYLADRTHPEVVAILADALGRMSKSGAAPTVMAASAAAIRTLRSSLPDR